MFSVRFRSLKILLYSATGLETLYIAPKFFGVHFLYARRTILLGAHFLSRGERTKKLFAFYTFHSFLVAMALHTPVEVRYRQRFSSNARSGTPLKYSLVLIFVCE